jgi:hypothetical protein
MTADEIREQLKRLDGETADSIETQRLDLKEWNGKPADWKLLRETVVCFANAGGGVVVLGVADKVKTRAEALIGVPPELQATQVQKAVFDGTAPNVIAQVEEIQEPEARLLAVHVPPRTPMLVYTTTEGVGKIRVGKDCQPLTGLQIPALIAASTDPMLLPRRAVFATAVRILRETCGKIILTSDGAHSALPGTLWFGKRRDWAVVVQRIGGLAKANGQFTPHVEPALFDGSDDLIVSAAQEILTLYLWSEQHWLDFERVRTTYQLPAGSEVRRILAAVGSPVSALSVIFDPTDPLCGFNPSGDDVIRVRVVNRGSHRVASARLILESMEPQDNSFLFRPFLVMRTGAETFELSPNGAPGVYVDVLGQSQSAQYGHRQALRVPNSQYLPPLETLALVLRLQADEPVDPCHLTFRRGERGRMQPVLE